MRPASSPPYAEERFEFAVPRRRGDERAVQTFAEVLADDHVRAKLRERGFVA